MIDSKRIIWIVALLGALLPGPVRAQEKAPDYAQYILTPPAPDTPRINGPKVYGARLGRTSCSASRRPASVR